MLSWDVVGAVRGIQKGDMPFDTVIATHATKDGASCQSRKAGAVHE
jgi:hypothetical protein